MLQKNLTDSLYMPTFSRSTFVIVCLLGALLAGALVHSFGVPFRKARASNVNFLISGVTGGTDSTADAWLSNGTDPTIVFSTYNGVSTYDVVIKDDAGVVTLCSALAQAGSPVSVASCGLSNGTAYKAYVTAKPSNTPAFNTEFSFTVDNTAPTTNTITGMTGASDAVVDDWLTGGLIPTVNWNAFANAGSYDVTIKDSTGTTDVCATQNTTSTSYTFSGCTLTDGTAYRAYVTARSPAGFQSTAASNNAFNFTVEASAPGAFNITGITGGTDVLTDGYLTDGGDPTVVYGTSANAYRYDIVIKDSTGTTTICSLSDEINSPSALTCGLTDGLSYKAYVTAKSVSGFLTTTASNDGFSFVVTSTPPASPGNFYITGITGGSDTTADNWLTSGTTATVSWTTSYGAQNYSVTIRNSTDTADICATQNSTGNSYTFSGCTLSVGQTYLAKVAANNSPADPTDPLNNSYPFTVIASAPALFNITGATGGIDFIADDLLMSGTTVTANWTASSGATSYDVTIRNSTDSADVCATQNTASTSYNFSGCTLSANTSYLIKVTAKNAVSSTPAYNSPFSFFVPNSLTFCPTGSSTAKALIIYDSGGPSGNYSGNEDCNFTISPPATASNIVLDFITFASNDNGDVFSAYDGTSTSGTLLGTYKNLLVAPSDLYATSGNMYLTWKSGSANHEAGYSLSYRATYPSAGGFSISGVQGGSDVAADNLLTDNSSGVTVVWGASANAVSYSVVIRDNTNSYNICQDSASSTSHNLASCSLALGASYVVLVYATDNNGATVAASNNPFSFTYENRPTSFTISGITGGTDTTADTYLEDGTTATVTWTASSGQSSYDVTIYASDGFTPFCSTTNVGAGSTSHTFTGCTLVSGQYYKAEVIAKNANGSVLASNSPLGFKVGTAWIPTGLTGAPTARSAHTAVWTGSEMIIWGGGFNLGSKYNPTTDSWTSMTASPLTPSGRTGHTAVWTGSEMLVWGGRRPNDSSAKLNNGGRYNPSSNSWVESSLSLVGDRYRHSAVWTGSEMIVWGGHAGTGVEYLNTGGKYNPSTDSWTATSIGTNVPSARSWHTAVWTDSEMIVWGGYNGSGLNTGGRYNPSTDSWVTTSTGTNVPSARYNHTVVWTGSEMIVWGGASSTNTGGRYDPATDSWTTTSTGANVPSARTDHTAIWTGTKMIVWGGGSSLNTGGLYDPSANTWTSTSTGANVPSGRSNHSAIWTGSEMIIWGGYGGSAYLNTGGKYDPATDSWSSTSTGTNVPNIRRQHSAVWTGTEMIVWGGYSGSPLGTGGKYDPATDSWASTSTGPSIRYEHTAVWTGSEMIVFAGNSGGGRLNNGGRYTPSSNSWSTLSTGASSVPEMRDNHTVVWTGTEMIVWGGNNGTARLNTGGKYSPGTDTWTSTSTGANTPSARESHTAVWTGSEMIIWGGNTPTKLNTGGRYNPSTDSWSVTSTGANVPVARYDHTAVWTGTEMIIWGGQASTLVNSGGKYNPTTDSWTATSTGANVPDARNMHTAIWTGTEMIIWGGYSSPTRFDTGGKYNPQTDTWSATSLTNVPEGRYFHSAIWTGLDMIVWGGLATSSTNSGGIYAP